MKLGRGSPSGAGRSVVAPIHWRAMGSPVLSPLEMIESEARSSLPGSAVKGSESRPAPAVPTSAEPGLE